MLTGESDDEQLSSPVRERGAVYTKRWPPSFIMLIHNLSCAGVIDSCFVQKQSTNQCGLDRFPETDQYYSIILKNDYILNKI